MSVASANRVLIAPTVSPAAHRARRDGRIITLRGASMGTTWCVHAVVHDEAIAADQRSSHDRHSLRPSRSDLESVIAGALDLVVAQMSGWRADSDLSRFNRAPPDAWYDLPDECFCVLRHAMDLADATAGAYDPAIGALVDIWGFGPCGSRTRPPSDVEIERARARSGWRRLRLDVVKRRVHQPGEVAIDLSSIAKGYAVDLVAAALEARGVQSYLVEIGGELRGAGCKPDRSPWWVELESAALAGVARTLIAASGVSIASSGDYHRFLVSDGVRYSHTLDARTGRPIANDLAAVTVVAAECMHADAIATALTVLGLEAGFEFAQARDIAALFVQRTPQGFSEHMTPALRAYLED